MQLASYVKRSPHGVFYLRVVIPSSLRAKLAGRREIRRSLGTRDPRTAREWAHRLSYIIRLWVHEAHVMKEPDVSTLLASLRVTRISPYEIDIARGIYKADPRIPGDQQAMLATIEKLGLNGPNGPAMVAALRGNGPTAIEGIPQALMRRPISFVVEEFLVDLHQRTLNKKTCADYRAILQRFQEVVGDKMLADVTPEDVAKFTAAEADQELSYKTRVKHVSAVHTVFKFAQSRMYFSMNLPPPTAWVIRQMKSKRAHRTKRLNFSQEDLQAIFRPDNYLEWNNSRANFFWLPLLALFTGGRIEEYCQLYLSDVQRDSGTGIWYLDINQHQGKKTKNEASCRRVPLHPELIDLGFLTYRDAIAAANFEDKHLFPYLPVNVYGNRSDSSSKHFGRFLRGTGIADPRKVFHSFRHSVGTELRRTSVPVAIAHRLLGHTINDGEHATYVHGDIPLRELYENGIVKLRYPGLALDGVTCSQERIGVWIQRLKIKLSGEA